MESTTSQENKYLPMIRVNTVSALVMVKNFATLLKVNAGRGIFDVVKRVHHSDNVSLSQ